MIPFTRYHLPNGRTSQEHIERPADIEAMANRVIESGLRFEIEVLTTGEVSMTVVDDEEGVDLFIEICPNGPGIAQAVDKLVTDAHASL